MGDFHHGRGCEQRQRDYLTRWQPSPEEPERTRASPEARAEPWRDIIPRCSSSTCGMSEKADRCFAAGLG